MAPSPTSIDADQFRAVLQLLPDLLPDGVLIVDAQGTIVYANETLYELFGYASGTLTGLPVETLVSEDSRADHRRQRALLDGQSAHRTMGRPDLDIEGLHFGGRLIPIDVRLSPLPAGGFIVAVVRDMTAVRSSAVDHALARLDLRTAHQRIARIEVVHDEIAQRLFALATALASSPRADAPDIERLAEAVDDMIVFIRAESLGATPLDAARWVRRGQR